ncbi:hypothetical protein LCGC14_1631490 [marine sediment metagenome]|uniref:Uncharacterized protein n=1 Tax=marine sediment metagenome TaxID=412755 RepID=A0A0F9IPN4_9ZZZZ
MLGQVPVFRPLVPLPGVLRQLFHPAGALRFVHEDRLEGMKRFLAFLVHVGVDLTLSQPNQFTKEGDS